MSETRAESAPPAKGLRVRALQLLVLAVVVAVQATATRYVAGFHGSIATVAAVGFLLLSGTLLAELLEPFGLPHLTGYLVAGVIAGPHLAGLVDRAAVAQLSHVNTLALALIALAGGAELRAGELRRALGSLISATLLQNVAGLVLLTASFVVAARFIPFAHGLGFGALCGVGLLWAVVGTSRSPSATLAILSQTRAGGPLASFSLAFIMLSDVVVILLLAVVLLFARPLIDGTPLSFGALGELGHEVVGSAALGITLGLVLAGYLRLIGGHLLVVLVAIGFGVTEGLNYLRFDPLLTFLIAGFVVQNLSAQGDKLLNSIERTGGVVYVVFFATAGTDLDVPLLEALWPVALSLAATRGLVTWGAHRLGSRLASDAPEVRRWGWTSMIAQAGLSLGLAAMVAQTFPSFGAGFRSLAIATLALNQLVGPVLFKIALDRAGASGRASAPNQQIEHVSIET